MARRWCRRRFRAFSSEAEAGSREKMRQNKTLELFHVSMKREKLSAPAWRREFLQLFADDAEKWRDGMSVFA
ncbi:hypothetical protein GJ654_19740 [Rhodoblastus acidophilus]|uniref:Uncharacterized protein n=1 Tax=Rhodoblastus acidophilus TaxID=1074 RepID=A0A6N8DS37_RHOAC|nr:hypothetical protein [Rhodoblastus acidophilus]MCW2276106.1 hypothetical protein [Rhodoblastus acidophilus]MTV33217.1 hypothetical protein [Rhodoblastus acidophilus]